MELMYFLLVVAACAAGLIWFMAKTMRNRERVKQANRNKHLRHPHQPRHHERLSKHGLHGRAHHAPQPVRDVWAEPKRRELAEARGSYPLTAHKIESDAEREAGRDSDDLSMPEIKYVPTWLPGKSGSKR